MRVGGCIVLSFIVIASGYAGRAQTRDYLKKDDNWFKSSEAEAITANILSWQSERGGWPKNIDVTAGVFGGKSSDLKPTFDNSATTDELRFLARVYDQTHDRRCKEAFNRGFDYIIEAQYPSGGWPQYYPPSDHYHRYITFNDGAMVRLLRFLQEVIEDEHDYYGFLARSRERKAEEAFSDGIDCILECQVKVDGKRTVWCAQHDEINYEPRPGRAFELVSLSGSESVGIVDLLMSLKDPEDEVIKAVDAAVAWFREVQIRGIRIDRVDGNKVVVEDADAHPLWARFYEIGSNRPFFSGRDGVKKYDVSEIEAERRNGYAWYGTWPQRLLENDYPVWKQKNN